MVSLPYGNWLLNNFLCVNWLGGNIDLGIPTSEWTNGKAEPYLTR